MTPRTTPITRKDIATMTTATIATPVETISAPTVAPPGYRLVRIDPRDHVERFLSEGPFEVADRADDRLRAGVLRAAYATWCDERGIPPLDGQRLAIRLAELGIDRYKRTWERGYRGLRLKESTS
jgi:hypothetical protein